MTSMYLSEVAGEYEIDVEQFLEFIQCWYRPQDLVVISRKAEDGKGTFDSWTTTAEEYMQLDQASFESFVTDSKTGLSYDLYVGVCPLKHEVSGTGRRANNNDVARMPGVWMDLDVKDGAFDSKEDILEFLNRLPLKPSIIVDSGNGIHIYLKFREKNVTPNDEISKAFQDFVRELSNTGGDNTGDLSRLLRASGSIHTGKGSGVYRPVKLLKGSRTAYSVEVVRELVRDATERMRARRASVKIREQDLTYQAIQLSNSGPFAELLLKANHEEFVNENIDWSEIMEEANWELSRELGDGSREWTRPSSGEASKRSATTDHPGKTGISNVMSLLSEDPSTKLLDLKDAKIPISKSRAMLRLWFDDNTEAMFQYLADRFINNNNTNER